MKKKLFYFLKSYFSFTKREARGFVLVMPCLILFYFIPIIYHRAINYFTNIDYEAYQLEADIYFSDFRQNRKSNDSTGTGFHNFNPNLIGKDYLLNIGLHPRIVQNWVKYRERGGKFNQTSDLTKIYGMNDSILLALSDYLIFDTIQPESATNKRVFRQPTVPAMNKIPFIEADSITLQIVPGIGQVLAGRIIKFRDNLGGLHDPNQLLDVYGVEENLVGKVFDHFIFVPRIDKKLEINNFTIAQLAQHPYISYAQAKVIVAYRDQHGNYQQPEDLLKIKIFTQEWLDKIEPYLIYN